MAGNCNKTPTRWTRPAIPARSLGRQPSGAMHQKQQSPLLRAGLAPVEIPEVTGPWLLPRPAEPSNSVRRGHHSVGKNGYVCPMAAKTASRRRRLASRLPPRKSASRRPASTSDRLSRHDPRKRHPIGQASEAQHCQRHQRYLPGQPHAAKDNARPIVELDLFGLTVRHRNHVRFHGTSGSEVFTALR